MKIVLDYLVEYEEITDEELQELLNIKRTRTYLLTRQMKEAGLIISIECRVKKRYQLKKK